MVSDQSTKRDTERDEARTRIGSREGRRMLVASSLDKTRSVVGKKPFPAGRIKIAEALTRLLADREFSAITTAAIASAAGVTEALIYKYFRDKRDLLHQILAQYTDEFLAQLQVDLKGIKGALNKLRKLIWSSINCYAENRVYARILLLEVRNHPDYFKSEAYEALERYGTLILDIIDAGVSAGEIRDDIPPAVIRQVLLGAIEHVCLPGIIFNREISADDVTEDVCTLLMEGLAKRRS